MIAVSSETFAETTLQLSGMALCSALSSPGSVNAASVVSSDASFNARVTGIRSPLSESTNARRQSATLCPAETLSASFSALTAACVCASAIDVPNGSIAAAFPSTV